MAVGKTCEHCGQTFQCGGAGCWCRQVPLTQSQRDGVAAQFQDCLCPHCLPQFATDRGQSRTDVPSDQSGCDNRSELLH